MQTAGLIAGAWLGALLLVAAFGKAVEPVVFVQQIRNEGLDFLLTGRQVAVVALALEAGLGTALVVGVRSWLVMLPTAGLVVFFLFLTGRNYVLVLQGLRDPSYDCGCFGFLWERTAVEAFWQDLFLLVPALLVALWSRRGVSASPAPRRLAAGLFAALLVVGYAVGIAGLPPDLPRPPAGLEREFAVSEEFEVRVGGEAPAAARLYQSSDSMRFVLVDPALDDPLLLDVASSEVFRLPAGALSRFNDDTATVDPTAELGEPAARFRIGSTGLTFSIGDREVEIRNR